MEERKTEGGREGRVGGKQRDLNRQMQISNMIVYG